MTTMFSAVYLSGRNTPALRIITANRSFDPINLTTKANSRYTRRKYGVISPVPISRKPNLS